MGIIAERNQDFKEDVLSAWLEDVFPVHAGSVRTAGSPVMSARKGEGRIHFTIQVGYRRPLFLFHDEKSFGCWLDFQSVAEFNVTTVACVFHWKE